MHAGPTVTEVTGTEAEESRSQASRKRQHLAIVCCSLLLLTVSDPRHLIGRHKFHKSGNTDLDAGASAAAGPFSQLVAAVGEVTSSHASGEVKAQQINVTSVDAESVCATDEWRHGVWVATGSVGCGAGFAYENASCGPPFSPANFCKAVAGRSLLLVGDSITNQAFTALAEAMQLYSQVRPQHGHNKRACTAATPMWTFVTCGGASRIAFERHDYGAILREGHDRGSMCDEWHTPAYLNMFDLVVLETGAHVQSTRSVQAYEAQGDLIAEAIKAGSAGRKTRGTAPLIFVRTHWGLNVSEPPYVGQTNYTVPLKAPLPIQQSDYGWSEIPLVSQSIVSRLRTALQPDRIRVIDPSMALALRPDCRSDPVHFPSSEVSQHMTTFWRMVQQAITNWPTDLVGTRRRS